MNKRMETTVFAPISFDDPLLTGEEVFPITGPDFRQVEELIAAQSTKLIHDRRSDIMRTMKGLNRLWSCLEKSILVRDFIGSGVVNIGSLLVWNNERNGTYGYYYNPPFEFHSWLTIGKGPFIVDFGLPGVIEKGLQVKDQLGAILKNMKPYILCGPASDGLEYTSYEQLSEDVIKEVAAKYSLDIN